MIDLRNLGLLPGQKLRLKTKDETVIGKFKRISKDGMSIEITEVRLLNGTTLGKNIWYFREEIKDIKVEKVLENHNQATSDDDSKFFTPTISKAQSDRIQKMMEEVVYIKQANVNYYEALTDISESLFIGLYAENAEMGR